MPTTAGYEFNAEQNQTFQALVRNMSRSGVVAVVSSVILLAYHLVDYFGISLGADASPVVTYVDYSVWFVISVLGIVIGARLVRATAAFTALIKTEGNDVEHLMSGVGRLAAIFGGIFWAAIVASLLLALSFALLVTYS